MSKFSYKARDREGKEVSGYRDADDRYELARFLRRDGYLLLSAEDVVAQEASNIWEFKFSNSFLKSLGRVRLAEKIIFSKNLGVMIGAGLTLTRALDALKRESRNQKFQDIISDVADNIRKGKSFSESLAAHGDVFPPLYVSMVEAGEKSGKLQESLGVLASQMQADYDLVRKVRGAMIYPSVILVAMIIIGALMMIYVVPTLTEVFEELNVELPAPTRFIIGVSNFFVNHTILILSGGLLSLVGLWRLKKTSYGKAFLDKFFISAPILGPLAKKFNAARTARTLSSLISAGVSILESLDITARVVQNHLYTSVLAEARAEVQRGESMSKVFLAHEDVYPSLMGEMLSVGEETGESSKMLGEVANFYEQQVTEATKDLSTIIEPVLMIIIGVAVGFFAISMLTPMYSLTDAIQ